MAGAGAEQQGGSGAKVVEFGAALAGKYMSFKLAKEEYALQILKVREIIGMMEITRAPRTAAFIRGVINLRGKVIPVVDLRLKFGMERVDATDQTVIIVVQYALAGAEMTMGILVDEVLEVLDIKSDQIEPPPAFGGESVDTQFILGVGKSEKRVIFLLDIGKVLTASETVQLRQSSVS
jgi:purine-binding chemotaxis protein CheW